MPNIVRVTVVGSYAYVADGDSGLRTIDVPTGCTYGGELTTRRGAYAAVVGNYAYVADGDAGLRVIDILAPETPTEVGRNTPGNAANVAVLGDYAYVADEDGVYASSISSRQHSLRLARDIPGTAWGSGGGQLCLCYCY